MKVNDIPLHISSIMISFSVWLLNLKIRIARHWPRAASRLFHLDLLENKPKLKLPMSHNGNYRETDIGWGKDADEIVAMELLGNPKIKREEAVEQLKEHSNKHDQRVLDSLALGHIIKERFNHKNLHKSYDPTPINIEDWCWILRRK